MAKFPTFLGRGKFLGKKLRLCAEAKAAGEFEAMKGYAEEGLNGIPEAKAEKYSDHRRGLLVALADAAYNLGDDEAARDAISQAVSLSDEDTEFVSVLAQISEGAGDEVVPILKQGIIASKQDVRLLKPLSRIYSNEKKVDKEGDKIFRLVLLKDAEYKPALLGLARSSVALKRYDREMLTPLRIAFRFAPDNAEVLKALAMTYAGMVQPPEESLGVLKKAREEFPEERGIFHALTKIFVATPGYDDAKVEHLRQAYGLKPSEEVAQVLLPYFLKTRAESDVALAVYEVSWKGHEQKAAMLEHLAKAYCEKDKRDETAIKVYEELFAIYPHNKGNTVLLADIYAVEETVDRTTEIVCERAFRDSPSEITPAVVKLLSRLYLNSGREDDLAKGVYLKQFMNDPDDTEVLIGLCEISMEKEHLSSEDIRLLKRLFHTEGVQRKLRLDVAIRIGDHLAHAGAGDAEAVEIYEFTYANQRASEAEENLLASHYARGGVAEPRYRRLFESVYSRTSDEDVLQVLTDIYIELKEVDDQAIDIFIAHLKMHPGDKKVLGLVCPYLLKKRGKDPETYPFIVEALKLDSKIEFIGMKENEVNSALISIGRHFISLGQYNLALELFRSAYTRSEDTIIQYLMGISYLAAGDIPTASSIFADLLKGDPENPQYLYRTAAIKIAEGDLKQARKQLEKLGTKYKGHPLPLLRLGMLCEAEGKPKEALTFYNAVKSTETRIGALALARKGIVYLRDNSSLEAVKVLEQAREILGENSDISRGLAAAYTGQVLSAVDANDIKKASETISRMLRLKGNDPAFMETLGILAFLVNLKMLVSGMTKEASMSISKVLEKIPEQAGSLFLGALLEHFNRRLPEAQGYLDRALDLGRRLCELEPQVQLLSALNLIRMKRYFEANDHLEWLYAQQKNLEDAFILRIISFYQNQREKGYPSFLKGQDYSAMKERLKLSLGFMGSLFLKGGEFKSGISFFEKVYKGLGAGQEKIEADFFLGLFHIKLKKEKVGLHYWRNIIDLKSTEGIKPDILNQIFFSLYLHFLDNYHLPEAEEALSRINADGQIDMDTAALVLLLQKGYVEAKSGNPDAACREWEKGLAIYPSNWMLNQNLALAKVLLKKEDEAVNHFNVLIRELERGGEKVFGDMFTFIFEESRKIYNHLVSLRAGAIQQVEAKRDIINDNIESANRAYWSLNLRKGDAFKEAEISYFRLIKVYNPERYPEEFKEIEAAYAFFRKEGHLRKNEQLVYNSFDLKRLIELGSGFVQSEIPQFPSVRKFISEFTKPARFFDLGDQMKSAREAASERSPAIPGSEYLVDDWLLDW